MTYGLIYILIRATIVRRHCYSRAHLCLGWETSKGCKNTSYLHSSIHGSSRQWETRNTYIKYLSERVEQQLARSEINLIFFQSNSYRNRIRTNGDSKIESATCRRRAKCSGGFMRKERSSIRLTTFSIQFLIVSI